KSLEQSRATMCRRPIHLSKSLNTIVRCLLPHLQWVVCGLRSVAMFGTSVWETISSFTAGIPRRSVSIFCPCGTAGGGFPTSRADDLRNDDPQTIVLAVPKG